MPNDARNKLRNMGGIMASYPELMQAATQRYQTGGNVTVPMVGAPMGLSPVGGPMGVYTPQRAAQLQARMRAEALRPRAGLESMIAVPEVPMAADAPVEDVVVDLVDNSGALTAVPPALLQRQNEVRAARGLPPLSTEQKKEFKGAAREMPSPLDVAKLDEISGEIEEIENRQVDGVFASSADRARAEELAAERSAIRRRVGETLAAEDTAMSMPLQPKSLTQEQIDKVTELTRKDPNFTPPAADEEGPVEDADTDTGTGTGGPAPAPSKKDLRSRYEEKIALFKEIYGEDDEERARDKAMSLAMMGLAIAAGQSPDALTNIARGAAVGLQGMSEQEQARRERERGLQTLALQTAISEEEALRDADIRASQSELEFQRDMSMEEYKARLNAMYGAGSRDARNIIDFTQNAYDSAYTAASEQTAPDYNSEVETPHQYAMRQAQQAAASMQKMFPGYGGQTVGTPASEGATVPTVTTQEEYDALPSGAQFMQNGQMRRKP